MAMIVFVITDEEETGKVDIHIQSYPSFDLTEEGILTDAQVSALTMLEAIQAESKNFTAEVID